MSKDVFKLEGADELKKIFDEFPAKTVKRAQKTGLSKAGSRLRTLIRRDAPRISGDLRRAIKVKRHRNGSVSVGIKEKYYYKTLEFMYPSGGEYHPWFMKSIERHGASISQLVLNETKLSMYNEAGKAYSRSRSKLSYASVKGRR